MILQDQSIDVAEHGKFALIHNGKRVDLFDDHAQAYTAGMDRFGSADGELLFDIHEIGGPPAIVMTHFVDR